MRTQPSLCTPVASSRSRLPQFVPLSSPDEPPADLANQIGTQLQRLKWFCWHGNAFRALRTVDDLIFDLHTAEAAPIEQVRLLNAFRVLR
jgi:hypothetical protein